MGYFLGQKTIRAAEFPGDRTVYATEDVDQAHPSTSQVQLNTSTETVIATVNFTITPVQAASEAGLVVAFDAPFLYRPTGLIDAGWIDTRLYLDGDLITNHFLGTAPSTASPTAAPPCTIFGAMSLPANLLTQSAGMHTVEVRSIGVVSVGNPDMFYNGDIAQARLSLVIAEI